MNLSMNSMVIAAVLGGAAIGGWVLAQDHPGHHDHPGNHEHPGSADANGGMTPEMMQAWMAYATPGEGQALLATRVGKWNVELKHWMGPDAPAETAEGTCKFEMVFDGRFLGQEYESAWEGMPFHGIGITAYNNVTKKLQFTWLDNMSTGLMQGSGEIKGHVLTWTAMGTDPLKGDMPIRGTETFDDPDRFVSVMYGPGPDGKEFKMMEFVYTRVSGGDHDHEGHDHDHSGHGHDHGGHGHDHPHHDHPG